MTLSYGPVEPSDGTPVTARCALLWEGTDGEQRHVGFLERLDHPEGGTMYQWSTPLISGPSRDAVLDSVVRACQSCELPSGKQMQLPLTVPESTV